MGKIIGTRPDEVSSAWVDYWSFGHLLFGAVAYFIIYAIVYYVFATKFPDWFNDAWMDVHLQAGLWGLIGATICGIVWEPIENIGLVKLGWKKKKDSLINSVTDVIFVFLGALILYFVHTVWVNLVLCIAFFVLLIVLGTLTEHNK